MLAVLLEAIVFQLRDSKSYLISDIGVVGAEASITNEKALTFKSPLPISGNFESNSLNVPAFGLRVVIPHLQFIVRLAMIRFSDIIPYVADPNTH